MGLYIQGIELPKEQNVPTWAVIFSNGEVRIYKDGFNTDQGNGKGTAIPVPPHGRLINADALFEKVYKAWGTEYDAGESNWFMDMINEAPTIIPAEEAQP